MATVLAELKLTLRITALFGVFTSCATPAARMPRVLSFSSSATRLRVSRASSTERLSDTWVSTRENNSSLGESLGR